MKYFQIDLNELIKIVLLGTETLKPPQLHRMCRLKVEMYYGEKFESSRGFIEKLEEYIHYYNNERISLKLNRMSPVQYRAHSITI